MCCWLVVACSLSLLACCLLVVVSLLFACCLLWCVVWWLLLACSLVEGFGKNSRGMGDVPRTLGPVFAWGLVVVWLLGCLLGCLQCLQEVFLAALAVLVSSICNRHPLLIFGVAQCHTGLG